MRVFNLLESMPEITFERRSYRGLKKRYGRNMERTMSLAGMKKILDDIKALDNIQ